MDGEKILAKNLLALRKAHRKNQDQIAEICCVDRTTVSCWERGTRNPNIDSLDILSEYYGVTTEVLLNQTIEATYEASNKRVSIRVTEQSTGWALDSESTKFVVEGPIFKTLLTNPRMGLEKEKAYQFYKRAVEIDYAIDIDDDRILEAMDDYWYAYNHGIDEAGVNLLRIYFLLILVSRSIEIEVLRTLQYLIEDMQNSRNPSGDYYYALSLIYQIFPEKGNEVDGMQLMKQLADSGNDYAEEAITYIQKGKCLWED